MKTLLENILVRTVGLACILAFLGCAEAKEKSAKATRQAAGEGKIQQGDKARQALQRVSDERNSELEEISGNRSFIQ